MLNKFLRIAVVAIVGGVLVTAAWFAYSTSSYSTTTGGIFTQTTGGLVTATAQPATP